MNSDTPSMLMADAPGEPQVVTCDTTPPYTSIGRPVAIEFVDHVPNVANEVAKVFHCIINGEHVAVSGDHPVTIHGVSNRDEPVAVTLTLLARDVRIGAPRMPE